MGIVKATVYAIQGTARDQYREYFVCDMEEDVLLKRGYPEAGEHGNNRASDNVITNGSLMVVAEGQALIVLDGGKTVDVCTEQGEYVYHTEESTSIFDKSGAKGFAKEVMHRISFGGDIAPHFQRVYYVNTKEILNNPFRTRGTIPVTLYDSNTDLKMICRVSLEGAYAYRVIDPYLFYKKIAGTVVMAYTKDGIGRHLENVIRTHVQNELPNIVHPGDGPGDLVGKALEFSELICETVSPYFEENYGIQLTNMSFSTIDIYDKDLKLIQDIQTTAVFKDPAMGAARLVQARSNAMEKAAENPNGAMGLMWMCNCGNYTTEKFCRVCGTKKPEEL